MSARYKPGEVVDIHLLAARVSDQHVHDKNLHLFVDGEHLYLPMRLVNRGCVSVERRWPAYGKPQPGEVWENPQGLQVFAYPDADGYTTMVSSTGARWDDEESALEAVGPLHRVYPPVEQPAVPVVEDQADELADEQPSYARSLRELADFFDANPDMPQPLFTLHVSGALGLSGDDPVEALALARRAAELLGVPLEDKTYGDGKRHVAVERQFGRVELRLSYVLPAESVIDGSPSDLEATGRVLVVESHGANVEDVDPAEDDAEPEFDGEHKQVSGWAAAPGTGGSGAACACGATYDGFDTHAEAVVMLDHHIASEAERTGEAAPSTADGGEPS